MAHLVGLYSVALEAQNYEDALKYANRQLEIDPANVEAWLSKARATIQQNTYVEKWFNEGMEYLKHAEQISTGNPRIKEESLSLQRLRADRCAWTAKIVAKNLSAVDPSRPNDVVEGMISGLMQDVLAATALFPDDPEYLAVLAMVANKWPERDWAKWNVNVAIGLDKYHRLIGRKEANEKLPQLMSELKIAQNNIANLRAHGSVLNSARIWSAQSQIKRLESEIARLRAFL